MTADYLGMFEEKECAREKKNKANASLAMVAIL